MTPHKTTFFGALLAFALLATWVLAGDAAGFDGAVRSAVHEWASPPLTQALYAITMLGSEWCLVPIGAIAYWRLWTTGRRRAAMAVPVVGIGAELADQVLKLAFRRVRPEVFFGLSPAETYSFPSGHAFVSMAFYSLLVTVLTLDWRRHRAIAMAGGGVLIALIGLSRVYLGYHYPSDVLGGWVGAVAWLTLARWILGTPWERESQDPKEQRD